MFFLFFKYRTKKTIRALESHGYPELIRYSLVIASEVLEDEHFSLSFELASKEKAQWLYTMN